MTVVRWEDGPLERHRLLTSEVRTELQEYTERDLLLSVTDWARKREG